MEDYRTIVSEGRRPTLALIAANRRAATERCGGTEKYSPASGLGLLGSLRRERPCLWQESAANTDVTSATLKAVALGKSAVPPGGSWRWPQLPQSRVDSGERVKDILLRVGVIHEQEVEMCWHRDRRALVTLLMAAAAAYFVACENSPRGPAAPDLPASQGAREVSQPAAPMSATSGASAAAVVICHRTGSARGFVRLSVAASAVAAHLKHGDGQVGDPVPEQPGMVFDATCAAVPAVTRVTVTFSGLSDDGAPFTTYTESGVVVTASEGSWLENTSFGNPAP